MNRSGSGGSSNFGIKQVSPIFSPKFGGPTITKEVALTPIFRRLAREKLAIHFKPRFLGDSVGKSLPSILNPIFQEIRYQKVCHPIFNLIFQEFRQEKACQRPNLLKQVSRKSTVVLDEIIAKLCQLSQLTCHPASLVCHRDQAVKDIYGHLPWQEETRTSNTGFVRIDQILKKAQFLTFSSSSFSLSRN